MWHRFVEVTWADYLLTGIEVKKPEGFTPSYRFFPNALKRGRQMHAPLHSVRGPLYPLVFLFLIFRFIIRYTIAVTYKYWQLEEEPLFEEIPRKNKQNIAAG